MSWASGSAPASGRKVRNFICPSIDLVASPFDEAGAEHPPDAFTNVLTP